LPPFIGPVFSRFHTRRHVGLHGHQRLHDRRNAHTRVRARSSRKRHSSREHCPGLLLEVVPERCVGHFGLSTTGRQLWRYEGVQPNRATSWCRIPDWLFPRSDHAPISVPGIPRIIADHIAGIVRPKFRWCVAFGLNRAYRKTQACGMVSGAILLRARSAAFNSE